MRFSRLVIAMLGLGLVASLTALAPSAAQASAITVTHADSEGGPSGPISRPGRDGIIAGTSTPACGDQVDLTATRPGSTTVLSSGTVSTDGGWGSNDFVIPALPAPERLLTITATCADNPSQSDSFTYDVGPVRWDKVANLNGADEIAPPVNGPYSGAVGTRINLRAANDPAVCQDLRWEVLPENGELFDLGGDTVPDWFWVSDWQVPAMAAGGDQLFFRVWCDTTEATRNSAYFNDCLTYNVTGIVGGNGFGNENPLCVGLDPTVPTVDPPPPAGGETYVALPPTRALDTRTTSSLAGPGSVDVTIGGAFGVPSNAKAVVLNVTSTGASLASFLTVYPTGEDRPDASNLNTEVAQDTPNLVIVPIGAGGQVTIFNNAGTGDVVADVLGYFPASSAFVPQSPTRFLDTRDTGILGGPDDVDVQVAGVNGIPSNVAAVVMNVTSTGATAPSFITAYPAGTTRPDASNLNTEVAQDTPNLVIVPVGTNGAVTLFNNAGSGHLIADVLGYFPTGTDFSATSPTRILDTRNGTGVAAGTVDGPATINVQVGGANGIPAGISAVVINVTSTGASAPSFVSVWAGGSTQPNASNLNTEVGQDTPNLVIVPVGADGSINLFNNSGSVHLIGDVLGYFS